MLSPDPSLVTYAAPAISAAGRRAFVSRRSYYFRLACSRRPVNEPLSLDLLRALWRVAAIKAGRIS